MDDLELTGEYSDEDGEILIGRAAVVQAPSQNAISASGKLIDVQPSFRRASSLGFSHPPLPHLQREEESPAASGNKSAGTNDDGDDDDDSRSVLSKRSAKSGKSSISRVGMVTAARTRSIRTSLGKLRIPSKKAKSRPSPGVRSAPVESHPPVPSMPMVFSPVSANPLNPPATAPIQSFHTPPPSASNPSFLNLESRNGSATSLVDESPSKTPPPVPVPVKVPQPRKTEIEDIKLEPIRYLDEHPTSSQRPLSVMDDIMIIPKSSRNGIEEVPHVLRKSVDEYTMSANTQRKMGRGEFVIPVDQKA